MYSIDNPWEKNAEWWQKGFTNGADAEYTQQLLPIVQELISGFKRVLDVGAGEGQAGRSLSRKVEAIIEIDSSISQLCCNRQQSPFALLTQGKVEELPFKEGAFDAIFACLVLEHVIPLHLFIDEISRVLRTGGRFLLVMNHPLTQAPDSGWIEDWTIDPMEKYWRLGPYLREETLEIEVEKGVFIPFTHRPLSSYVNKLSESNIFVERMLEPSPIATKEHESSWRNQDSLIPRFLVLVCKKFQTI